jgi:hypothetical protein
MRPRNCFSLRSWRILLVTAASAGALTLMGVAMGGKVREIVVRYDDGTEERVAAAPAAPAPLPPPAPSPLPDPPPAPAPVPEPDPQPQPGNAAPAVSIVTPADQAVAAAPAYLLIRADAADTDGRVRKVELYANDVLLDAPTAPPFLAAWTDVTPGAYDLVAKAFDDRGGVATSAKVRVTVAAPPAGREIVVAPGQAIGAAVAQAQPGDTVRVKAGAYTGAVIVAKGGTPAAPMRVVFEPGATLDAGGLPHAFIAGNGAAHVIVSGLHVIGCTNEKQGQNAAVRTGDGWRLEDCVVERTKATGIGVLGTGVTLLRCTARANGQNGISSSKGKVVLVKDCVISGNNTNRHNPASEGGGGKWARTDTVYVTGLRTCDNLGPGFWFDISNRNYVITRSFGWGNHGRNQDWEGPAFMTEINQGPGRIEGNVTWDNTGAGINIDEAQDLTVRDNTVVNDTIHLRNLLRKDGDWRLENVTITGNRFKNGYLDTSDAGESWRTSRATEWRLTIDGNTYDREPGKHLVKWGRLKPTTLDKVRQTLGIERAGRVGPVDAPAKPSAP